MSTNNLGGVPFSGGGSGGVPFLGRGGSGGVADATKTVVSEDFDSGSYNITSGTFEPIGLSIDVGIEDASKEDIHLSLSLPFLNGSTASAQVEIGIYVDNVLSLLTGAVVGNTGISFATDSWLLRNQYSGLGTVTVDVRARNAVDDITVDNSTFGAAFFTIVQHKDRP